MRLLVLAFVCLCGTAQAQDLPVIRDVVYGHKDGLGLTMDIFKPAKANGAAICFIPTGGWYSVWREPEALKPACQPFLNKGFTVFLIYHGSAPKYTIPEQVPDVKRAIRFIRLKSKDFGVEPERIGVWGGSAGGHLTLMLATTADDGDVKAKDTVLQQSCRIAAAVALFPPTDIRTWTTNPPEEIQKRPTLKPPLTFDAKKEKEMSPLLQVTEKTAPTLLIHGDRDELVPIKHSTEMIAVLEKAKVPSRLVTIEGAAHGFSAKQNETIVAPAMIEWFEKYLAK